MKIFIPFALILNFILSLDYSLEDVNTTSPTYGEFVGPTYFQNNDFSDENKLVSINYFGWETWNGWRQIFAQLCDLNNTNTWNTEEVVLIGIGRGLGGDAALDGTINLEGVNSPFVQDLSGQIWIDFLGSENAPRKQVVILDQSLNPRYQFEYGGDEINQSELNELLNSIQSLIDESNSILGDLNNDQLINVQDLILLVNIALGDSEFNQLGDINNDAGINILDVVLLLNQILLN